MRAGDSHEPVKRVVRLDHPGMQGIGALGFRRRCKQRGGACRLACAEQRPKECRRSLRAIEMQRHANAGPFEAAATTSPIDADAAAVDLHDKATWRIRGIEAGFQRRVDLLEERIDLSPPRRQQLALSQQRLRFVLESRRIAAHDPVATGFRLDACDAGDRLLQISSG